MPMYSEPSFVMREFRMGPRRMPIVSNTSCASHTFRPNSYILVVLVAVIKVVVPTFRIFVNLNWRPTHASVKRRRRLGKHAAERVTTEQTYGAT